METKGIDLIMQGIKCGDESAFELLYRAYYERLCRFANAIIHNQLYAEEVVDDVMLNTWNNRAGLKTDTIWGYLIRAVRNNSLKLVQSKEFRQNNHIVSLSDEGQSLWQQLIDSKNPIGWVIEHELQDQLQEIISSLPEECRCVFRMSREEGLSNQEIADRLGISKDTVKYHIKHALKIIRSRLSPVLFAFFVIRDLMR